MISIEIQISMVRRWLKGGDTLVHVTPRLVRISSGSFRLINQKTGSTHGSICDETRTRSSAPLSIRGYSCRIWTTWFVDEFSTLPTHLRPDASLVSMAFRCAVRRPYSSGFITGAPISVAKGDISKHCVRSLQTTSSNPKKPANFAFAFE